MIVPNSQIDRKKWDQCVLNAKPEGFYFMLSWYLDAVAPTWEGYIEGDYTAIYPLSPKRRFGIKYLTQPFMTRSFIPIGFTETQETDLTRYLSRHFAFLQLAGPIVSQPSDQVTRVFQKLDIKNFSLAVCSENHRRQYKKAQQQGFELRRTVAPEALIRLFKTVKGNEFKQVKEKDYQSLLRLMELAENKGVLHQFSIFKHQELVGTAAYIVIDGHALYLKGAVTPECQKLGGMVYLHVEAIQVLSASCVHLDFGGSNARGLGDFNRKFGAEDLEYLLLTRNKLPRLLKGFLRKKFGMA
jgi:hypothetical protein